MIVQLTHLPKNHQITNAQVWSNDSRFIFFDTRDCQSQFTGTEIGYVNVQHLKEATLYTSSNGACVGVVTCSPIDNTIVFIHGPEYPKSPWDYSMYYRRGVLLRYSLSCDDTPTVPILEVNEIFNLDGFCEYQPFIPGVLHGGSHVHMFSPDGQMISFTYDDFILNHSHSPLAKRNVAIGFTSDKIQFVPMHPRQYVGTYYCSLVSSTVAKATLGSDEIEKAYEECWIGVDGYLKQDGVHQKKAIAFVGDLRDEFGQIYSEIFIVDLPELLNEWETAKKIEEFALNPFNKSNPSYGLRQPTANLTQRRLTFTHQFKGIYQKTRHWLRSSPCGQYIAFLMQDTHSITQLWLAHTASGQLIQLTKLKHPVESTFSWHPSGEYITFIAHQAIHVCHISSKKVISLTDALSPPPNPEACVFSPSGEWIAFTRDVLMDSTTYRQVFMVQFIL